ncbi:MAG TPA: hypothetical protein VNC11_04925, partial [Gemmatimonadaceae bacterium]|nr:hypothetical protein [Gemmatimonadaceae bacterium]
MKSGFSIARLCALATILTIPTANVARAQENSAKRLASIVSVAVEEYKKAVDASGKLISGDEYT